ncbi:hypothetical protein ACT91Q_15575 [Brevibacillus thermoruber]|uniref:hypothetical protein n=1 Tax=Brevibacillus thermoruber TaxID=33942 RepID=UPI0040415372
MSLNFEDIIKILPNIDSKLEIFSKFSATREFYFQEESCPGFVGPNLSFSSILPREERAQVLLISASGAVGKSTFARQLSFIKRAPILDLSESSTIGLGSLTGAISRSFDRKYSNQVYSKIEDGEFFVIIDALDEGKLKTTESGFSEFIKDVADIASYNKDNPTIIMLGRTQIIETTWLLLSEQNVKANILHIDPFTIEQGHTYIEEKIKSTDLEMYKYLCNHRGQYEDVRDIIFQRIKDSISDQDSQYSEESKFFLGYAPVLDAISVLISKEKNYYSLKKRFVEEESTTSISILKTIVEEIIEREHNDKLIYNLKPQYDSVALEKGWNNWEDLYNSEEQSARLLSLIIGQKYNSNYCNIPDEIKSGYESALESWLPEHPFIYNGKKFANIVFESYVLAKTLGSTNKKVRLLAESYVNRPEYKDSPLLGNFYPSFSNTVLPEHLGLLYDSLFALQSETHKIKLTIDGSDPEDENIEYFADCEFEILSGEHSYSIYLTMSLDENSVVNFKTYLRDTHITLPCTVKLGHSSLEYELGPRVYIKSKNLNISTKTLIIKGDRAEPKKDKTNSIDSVVLNTKNYTGEVEKKPRAYIDLCVIWDGSEEYPWTDYSTKLELPKELPYEIYRRFRRIVTTLRSHSKGALARVEDKINHNRVLQGKIGEKILEQLIRDNILYLENGFYFWNSERADELLGIDWPTLRQGKSSEKLNQYLLELFEYELRGNESV